MKKFFTLVLCGFILGACGVDPAECDCVPEEENFFEVYYSGCVDLCTACASWAEHCKFEYTKTQCLEKHWFQGKSNYDCDHFKDIVSDWLTNKENETCIEPLEHGACMFAD